MSIEIENLRYDYGQSPVLDGINLSLSERRVALIGRNGSGKSTLCRAIAGLIEPKEGRVSVAGVDVFSDRKAAIAKIGILFQNPDHQIIFPTVGEEVEFGLRQLGLSREDATAKTMRYLETFGKAHWYERSVGTLSQGQRHLVCLISVLAMEPEVILLDEPFTGLDIPTTRALNAHLDRLDQQIVHVTHDPQVVAGYDRIIWIDEGRVVEDAAPDIALPRFLAAMEATDAGADL